MFWVWLWLALTSCIMITNHISKARGDKPSRALWEAIVANLIFGALLAWRSVRDDLAATTLIPLA
jgi:hypothetical protein